MPSLRIPVFAPDSDQIPFRLSPDEADRFVKRGKARWMSRGRGIRLLPHFHFPLDGGRTHTSRGPFLGAIGRSQCYTIADFRGRVTDFKKIDRADLHVFHEATLGCLREVKAG